MDISKYIELPASNLISDALYNDNIKYRETESTGMGDYARLSYCYAKDNTLIYIKIKCWSDYSDYAYEIDAANWQKAIDTIFKSDNISTIAEVFKTKTNDFPINIEDIFQVEGIKYHKWAWY